jgi:hypothetical protein
MQKCEGAATRASEGEAKLRPARDLSNKFFAAHSRAIAYADKQGYGTRDDKGQLSGLDLEAVKAHAAEFRQMVQDANVTIKVTATGLENAIGQYRLEAEGVQVAEKAALDSILAWRFKQIKAKDDAEEKELKEIKTTLETIKFFEDAVATASANSAMVMGTFNTLEAGVTVEIPGLMDDLDKKVGGSGAEEPAAAKQGEDDAHKRYLKDVAESGLSHRSEQGTAVAAQLKSAAAKLDPKKLVSTTYSLLVAGDIARCERVIKSVKAQESGLGSIVEQSLALARMEAFQLSLKKLQQAADEVDRQAQAMSVALHNLGAQIDERLQQQGKLSAGQERAVARTRELAMYRETAAIGGAVTARAGADPGKSDARPREPLKTELWPAVIDHARSMRSTSGTIANSYSGEAASASGSARTQEIASRVGTAQAKLYKEIEAQATSWQGKVEERVKMHQKAAGAFVEAPGEGPAPLTESGKAIPH